MDCWVISLWYPHKVALKPNEPPFNPSIPVAETPRNATGTISGRAPCSMRALDLKGGKMQWYGGSSTAGWVISWNIPFFHGWLWWLHDLGKLHICLFEYPEFNFSLIIWDVLCNYSLNILICLFMLLNFVCVCPSIIIYLSINELRCRMMSLPWALGLLGLGSMMNFPLSMGDFQDQAVHLPESTGWILGQNEENIMWIDRYNMDILKDIWWWWYIYIYIWIYLFDLFAHLSKSI